MKKAIIKNTLAVCALTLIVTALAILVGCGAKQGETTIKVSGAYALYPLMNVWAQEYQKQHPEVKIEVSGGGAGKGMADALSSVVDIGMVSRDIRQEEIDKGAFGVSVAKDAVVCTINAENPVIDKLNARGVTREELEKIFITREIKTWGELVGDPAAKDAIKVYTRADSCGAAETWAKFMGDYGQEDLTNAADAGIMFDPDLAGAVKNDKFGIGYNNINFAYDFHSSKPIEGVGACPIDINANGKIDPEEDFYSDQEQLLKAIAAGVYPSPPARDLHLVTKEEFKGPAKDFVKWILTDGQALVAENGYIPLSQEKLDAGIKELGE
jgi:phosphate transport system substrate-binding protein